MLSTAPDVSDPKPVRRWHVMGGHVQDRVIVGTGARGGEGAAEVTIVIATDAAVGPSAIGRRSVRRG